MDISDIAVPVPTSETDDAALDGTTLFGADSDIIQLDDMPQGSAENADTSFLSRIKHCINCLSGSEWVASDAFSILHELFGSIDLVLLPVFSAEQYPTSLRKVCSEGGDAIVIFHQDMHWTIATLYNRSGVMRYFDSLDREEPDELFALLADCSGAPAHFPTLIKHVKREVSLVPVKTTMFRTSAYDFQRCPKQTNSHDCGVAVLRILLYEFLGRSHPQSISHGAWRFVFHTMMFNYILICGESAAAGPALDYDRRQMDSWIKPFDVTCTVTFIEERIAMINEELGHLAEMGNAIRHLEQHTLSSNTSNERELCESEVRDVLNKMHPGKGVNASRRARLSGKIENFERRLQLIYCINHVLDRMRMRLNLAKRRTNAL